MGKTSQRKGRAGEPEFARILRDQGYMAEPGAPVSRVLPAEPAGVGCGDVTASMVEAVRADE